MGFDKEQRPRSRAESKFQKFTDSTAASTALDPRGLITLETTSTGAPVVYTLNRLPKRGDSFAIYAKGVASSSVAPLHINAAALSFLGASSEEMLTLAIEGNGAEFIAISSARWACIGSNGATFSTST